MDRKLFLSPKDYVEALSLTTVLGGEVHEYACVMEDERKTFNKDKKHWLRYLTHGIFINEKYGISSEKIVDFRKALGLIPESKNS